MFKKLIFPICLGIATMALALSLRGLPGNPSAVELSSDKWTNKGPFELSPERGRYALTYSLVEDHSLFFSTDLARFTTPDLGYKNGHYVSLFAPGVSYITSLGYQLGRLVNLAEVGTVAVVAIFAIFNFVLIYQIGKSIGASRAGSLLSAFIFLFATPAFSYGVTLYQHHFSTFLILLSLFLTIRKPSIWSLAIVWFCCALSIPLDYPNLFLMLPIGLYSLQHLLHVKLTKNITLRVFPLRILTLLTMLIPLGFFLWFNQSSYGDPLQFSGTVASVARIDSNGQPALPETSVSAGDAEKFLNPSLQQKDAVGFFKSRYLINDLYIHLFSPDRGVVVFAPILILAIFGIYVLAKSKSNTTSLLLGVLLANLLLYSLWGDPWGGWAFGSRYLIPGYAILCIFLSIAVTRFRRNLLFLIPLTILTLYGITINTAGALTTSANPPRVEVLALEAITNHPEPYSFDRNFAYLSQSGSKSFVYQTYLSHYLTPVQYYLVLTTILGLTGIALMIYSFKSGEGDL